MVEVLRIELRMELGAVHRMELCILQVEMAGRGQLVAALRRLVEADAE